MDPRYQLPTVVVTDLLMPDLDGADVLSQMLDPNLCRIVLTGKVGAREALADTYSGRLDGFFEKSEHDVVERVIELCYQLQRQYFCASQNASVREGDMAAFFKHGAAVDRVMRRLGRYEAYYLASEPFGYIGVMSSGAVERIGLFADDDLARMRRNAAALGAPDVVLERLRAHTHAAFLYPAASDDDLASADVDVWEDYLAVCVELPGGWWMAVDDCSPRYAATRRLAELG